MQLCLLHAACNAPRRFGARHAPRRNVLPSRRRRTFVPMRDAVATPQHRRARSDPSDHVVIRRRRGASFSRSVRRSPRRATSRLRLLPGSLPASARLASFPLRLFFNPAALACSAIAGWPWMAMTFPAGLSVRPRSRFASPAFANPFLGHWAVRSAGFMVRVFAPRPQPIRSFGHG